MNFAPLIPAGRSSGVHFGYSIRKGHKHDGLSLEFVLSAECIRKAKLTPDETLRLDADLVSRVARLTKVGSQVKLARPLRICDTGRGNLRITCSGPVAEAFGKQKLSTQPLKVIEYSQDGLIFELPTLETTKP